MFKGGKMVDEMMVISVLVAYNQISALLLGSSFRSYFVTKVMEGILWLELNCPY
jgi:hypothetical protein